MKRLLLWLQLIVVLLLSVPQKANALSDTELQWEKSFNLSCTPYGNSVYRFKLLAFAGSAFGNAWVMDDESHRTRLIVEVDNKEYVIMRYNTNNNLGNTDSGNREISIRLAPDTKGPDMGVFTFINGNDKTEKQGINNAFRVNMPNGKTIDQSYNGTYLEFDWAAPYNLLNGKTFKIKLDVWVNKVNSGPYNYKPNLGTFTYTSLLRSPSLAGCYLDPQAEKGDEGQMKLIGYSTNTAKSVALYQDGIESPIYSYSMPTESTFEFQLPQSDQTRVYRLQCLYEENGKDVTLTSTPLSVLPYHKINNFKLTEPQKKLPELSDGHKELTWEIDAKDPSDMFPSDYFLIYRACSPTFYDAQQIGQQFITDTVSAGKYKYVDDSDLAAYNTEGGTHNYYRIVRASSSGYYSTTESVYSRIDSVENKCCYLPAVKYVNTTIDDDYSDNHKVNVKIRMPLSSKISNIEKWNENANVLLFTKRILPDSTTELDSVLIKGSEVKYDNTRAEYYVEKEIKLNMVMTRFFFGARVSIPSSFDYLKFTDGKQTQNVVYDIESYYYSNMASASNIRSTQGTEYGKIRVTWDMPERNVDWVEIYRIKDGVRNTKQKIAIQPGSQNYYEDKTAELNAKYYYEIRVFSTISGTIVATYSKEDAKLSEGWVCPTGKVCGKVTTEEGVAMAQQKMVLKIGNDLIAETYTGDDGSYAFEGIELTNDEVKYNVTASDQSLKFEYNGDNSPAYVTINANNSLFENINFECTSTQRFSGRVLYDNSTIPVAGACFRINGVLVLDKDGNAVKTDNNGNFTFKVPQRMVTVQVVKQGHRFLNNGFIHDKNDEAQTSFTPLSAYDGLVLYDQTKVLLRGRVIGGNKQAELPLGKGLSTNNLGDNITLQMKLEGNNTADIVYLRNNKDKDTLLVNDTQMYAGKEVTHTVGEFSRKNITIHVDDSTGEYAMMLPPTKYRITQAYAQGYASLFANGEVSQVLDLTDSVAVDSTETKMATYSITYHSNVTIDFKQLQWGNSEVGYMGAKELKEQSLDGSTFTVQVATPVDEKGKYEYLLEHPVFLYGQNYWLRGTAHEDYYYNNVRTSDRHEQVNIEKGTVTVENGLKEGNPEPETFTLNENGMFTMRFVAGNNNFSLTGEDALRRLNASVEMNGYHYKAEPIEAYVTGQEEKDGEVHVDKSGNINIFDILRDPPGSGSYSWMSEGATYTMSRKRKFDFSASLNVDIKSSTNNHNAIIGTLSGNTAFTGSMMKSDNNLEFNFDVPIFGVGGSESGTYNYTLSHKITTSSDPNEQGAMSDVYLGTVDHTAWKTERVTCFIDSATYVMSQPSIEAGVIKVIQKGKEKQTGATRYLVSAEKLLVGTTVPTTFMYSQKDILYTVLPQLIKERNKLIVGGDSITEKQAQTLANNTKKSVYYYNGKKSDAGYGVEYTIKYPDEKKPDSFSDEVRAYNNQVVRWLNVITNNERQKLAAISSMATDDGMRQTYAVSSGQNIEHTEHIDYKYKEWKWKLKSLLVFEGVSAADFGSGFSKLGEKFLNKGTDYLYDNKDHFGQIHEKKDAMTDSAWIAQIQKVLNNDSTAKSKPITQTTVETPTISFAITFKPSFDMSYSDDTDSEGLANLETGYCISTGVDNSLNVTVVRTPADSILNNSKYSDLKAALRFVAEGNSEYYMHDYVFMVNGGATRGPWLDADSTLFYSPGSELSKRTLKIDNPTLTITDPEVSNIGEEDKAVFQVRLGNDSEVAGAMKLSHPSEFTLSVDDESNPDGAKVSMDGMPLTEGRTFTLNPGDYLNKTFEVTRGNGYEFPNLKLNLASKDDDNNSADASFSVYYLPSSSPVKISSPTDKWVLNTLAAKDTTGYYIPVVIEGYDIHHNNFDHIELQYKKSTEGEAGWTNLCSYYANDSLYAKASGTKSKEMIKSGRITHHFYGEKDPMEMMYDLRAVTFSRLGTGYVTKASDIISGTKDTRCPIIFGNPQPANGILTQEGSLILPFSEPIAYNYLDETSNFEVMGYTNKIGLDTDAGLVFKGENDQDAYTKVDRSLSGKAFTIDMLVKTVEDNTAMTFFSQADETGEEYMKFGINSNRQLVANINGQEVRSVKLSEPLTQQMTHVGMICDTKTDEATGNEYSDIKFFAGNSVLANDASNGANCEAYYGNAPIHLGVDCTQKTNAPFKGRMLEVRLWNRALESELISEYSGKELNGYSQSVMAYWPLSQSQGNVATESLNGADLVLENTAWQTVDGHSLRLNNKPLSLEGMAFQRSDLQDYTLSFWFRMNNKEQKDGYLFSAGRDAMAEKGLGKMRLGYENGQLIVRSQGATTVVDETGATFDQKWHNLTLSVSHSQNVANAYIDGTLTAQVSADSIGGIVGNDVMLGGNNVDVNIDILALWHQALPDTYIQQTYGHRLSGSEMGLYVYMPFNELEEATQGTLSYRFSLKNLAEKNKNFYKQTMVADGNTEACKSTDNAPVLKNQAMNKLKFSWASDGSNLLINLDVNDYEINHRNLFFTVRDVEDLNGNPMANPYTWTIYADRDVLRWDQQGAEGELKQGSSITMATSWTNHTSRPTNYIITSSSPYIQLQSADMGIAEAARSNAVRYTILDGLVPGHYNEYLWLYDKDNKMTDTYELTFDVTPNEPAWAVDRKKYDQTMNLCATVHRLNSSGLMTQVKDPRNIIGAFIGSDCVGVGNIDNNKNLYRLNMVIFGNPTIADKDIKFYQWDISDGTIDQLKADSPIKFMADTSYGIAPDDPVKLVQAESSMQDIALTAGWNWVSFNQVPDNMNSANELFFKNDSFSNGDQIKCEGKRVEYLTRTNKWSGDKMEFSPYKVYHIYSANGGRVSIVGTAIGASQKTVKIHAGWNALPYLLSTSVPIERFFTDFTIDRKAKEGDMIKGMTSFSALSSQYGWVGTLQNLHPGEGYYLLHNGGECDINFGTVSVTNNAHRKAKAVNNANDGIEDEEEMTGELLEKNMPVIAEIAEGETLPEGAVVRAYAGARMVAETQPITLPDGKQLYFISVRGNDAEGITLVTKDESENVIPLGHLQFNGATCIGTIEKPFKLSTKNVQTGTGDVYDIKGVKWLDEDAMPRGVYIQNGKKYTKK